MWKSILSGFNALHSVHPEPERMDTPARHRQREESTEGSRAKPDSTSNRNGLRANSNVQQRRIFANFFSTAPETKAAQANALIGKTIDPKVAEKYLHQIQFDGIGRIVAFNKNPSSSALKALQGAVIASLTQTNTIDKRDDARPGGDCLIQFMHLMRNAPEKTAQELLGQAKTLWMSGDLSDDAVAEFLIEAALKLADAPILQSTTVMLANAVSKPKEATQRNDNMYGRKFESEFAHALIKNPPAGMIDAARKIGQALLADLDQEYARQSTELPKTLEKMSKDIDLRAWTSEVPDLEKFMQEPSYDNLKAALLKVDNGYDIIKIQFLISHISGHLSHDITWKESADLNYRQVLQPARHTRPFQEIPNDMTGLSEDTKKRYQKQLGLFIKGSGYGTGLANHPEYEKQAGFYSAKDSSYGRMNPDMSKLSKMEQQALQHGHTIVTGLSGNANLLTHLSRNIAAKDKDFSPDQAALAGMMFLVFDGGHSLNEAMTVYKGLRPGEQIQPSSEELAQFSKMKAVQLSKNMPQRLADRLEEESLQKLMDKKQKQALAQHVDNYHLDYNEVIDLGKQTGNDGEVRHAMQTALGKAIDYFDQHSYFRTQNLAAGSTPGS